MIANVLYQNGLTYKMIDRKGHFISYSVARDSHVVEYVIFRIGVDRNGTEYRNELPMNFKDLDTLERYLAKWRALTNNINQQK
jgi:hypothetical protein